MMELAQQACLLEGITQLLAETPGDFAVLLHSDPDCANLVPRDRRACDPTRFYCTNLREVDVILGSSRQRLEQALRTITEQRRPQAIFVLGSCVASLLAEDLEGLTARLQPELGLPLVALPVGAMRLYGQAEILDLYSAHLAEMGTEAPAQTSPRGRGRDQRSVNLLGLPDDNGEAARLLEAIGVTVNVVPRPGDPAEVWARLARGALNAVTDVRPYRRLLERLGADPGLPQLTLDPPVGLAASEGFCSAIAAHFGCQAQAAAVLAPLIAETRAVLDDARARLAGARLAYHVGARKDFGLQTVLREGLLFAPLFIELGLAVEFLFQGAGEPAARERIAALLERQGLPGGFHTVPDRLSLTRTLQEHRFDVVYAAESLGDEVRAAGRPLIPLGTLRAGFAGAAEAARSVVAAVGRGGGR